MGKEKYIYKAYGGSRGVGAWGRGVCGFGDHSIDIGRKDSRTIENYVFWEMLRECFWGF